MNNALVPFMPGMGGMGQGYNPMDMNQMGVMQGMGGMGMNNQQFGNLGRWN